MFFFLAPSLFRSSPERPLATASFWINCIGAGAVRRHGLSSDIRRTNEYLVYIYSTLPSYQNVWLEFSAENRSKRTRAQAHTAIIMGWQRGGDPLLSHIWLHSICVYITYINETDAPRSSRYANGWKEKRAARTLFSANDRIHIQMGEDERQEKKNEIIYARQNACAKLDFHRKCCFYVRL